MFTNKSLGIPLMEMFKFQVMRFNPDKDEKRYMQDYELELEPTDVKLLDALVKLKAKDDSLSFQSLLPRRHLWL